MVVQKKTSEKQKAANRRNAKKSTGPRTAMGKAIACMNAYTHGLLTKHTLLPGEDIVHFAFFQSDMIADLAPEGAAERVLVGRIIDCAWRLRRILMVQQINLASIKHSWDQGNFYDDHWNCIPGKDRLSKKQWENYQENLKSDLFKTEELTTSMTMYKALQNEGHHKTLHRYEIQYERSMYKAMNQLERMQARRRGQQVLAPLAVDLSVSGTETQNN